MKWSTPTDCFGGFCFNKVMYYLKIKTIDENLKLVKVGLYQAKTDKWIKWVKINDVTIQILTSGSIHFNLVDGKIVLCKP